MESRRYFVMSACFLLLLWSRAEADSIVKTFSLHETSEETLSEVDRYLKKVELAVNQNNTREVCWYIDGTVSAGNSQGATYADYPFDFLPRFIRMHVDTAPSGAALIIDINDDGTSIFNTNAEIDDGGTEEDGNEEYTQSEIAAGSDITLDVDQVGSATAGADLTVCLYGSS